MKRLIAFLLIVFTTTIHLSAFSEDRNSRGTPINGRTMQTMEDFSLAKIALFNPPCEIPSIQSIVNNEPIHHTLKKEITASNDNDKKSLYDILDYELEITRECLDFSQIRSAQNDIIAAFVCGTPITDNKMPNDSCIICPTLGTENNYIYPALIHLEQTIPGWQNEDLVNSYTANFDLSSMDFNIGNMLVLLFDSSSKSYYSEVIQFGNDNLSIESIYSIESLPEWFILGYNAFEQEKYMLAAFYFEHGLRISPYDYSYASSAALSYIDAGLFEHATEMLIKCIRINPNAPEPYVYLWKIYPDVKSIPDEIMQLLKQGYSLTHDTRLAQFQ